MTTNPDMIEFESNGHDPESRMKNGQRSICPWTRAAWKPDKKSELNSWGSSTPKPLDSVRFGVTLAVPQKRAACPKIMRLLSGRK